MNKNEKRQKALTFDTPAYPDFDLIKLDNPEYQSLLRGALNYSNYMFELDELKKFAVKYAPQFNLKPVPSWEFTHLGQVCWILNQGGELKASLIADYEARLRALEEKHKTEEVETIKASTPKEKRTTELWAEIEFMQDEFIHRAVALDKASERVKTMLALETDFAKIRTHFQAQLAQINNPDFAEFFEKISAKQKKRMIEFYNFVIDLLDIKVASKTRKTVTRVKKVEPHKLVRKMKHMKDFKELELKSIPAEKIIFAKSLWVYNTKTRKLGQYVASTDKGFLVKGSSILNFDEKLSINKTLRKPKETLNTLLQSGKVEQRSLMEKIKTSGSPLTGRINADTILVKVY